MVEQVNVILVIMVPYASPVGMIMDRCLNMALREPVTREGYRSNQVRRSLNLR